MGLLDSVLGAVTGQTSQASAGGLSGLLGMVASNPQLLQEVTGLLGNDGSHGGLGGLVDKFQQAGLGHLISSWVGSGQNLPISADQLNQVLGSDALAGIAGKLGIDPQQAAGQLSQLLPGLIDHLTPQGQAPQNGLGNAGDLLGMLGGLLRR
jgi:uncharacterized protein YidB (DUF937 family)